jgi:hypothetical protein
VQNREGQTEDVLRKLAGVTHILKCIADEATGSARAEIDVARGILLRVAHETREAQIRERQAEFSQCHHSSPPAVNDSSAIITRRLPIRDFVNVEVDCAFVFEIETAPDFSVAITAAEGLFEYMNVTRSGNTLKLSHRPVNSSTSPVPEVRITMPALGKLRQGGASKGTIRGFNSTEPFDLFVSGASAAELDMTVGDVRMEISGSSRVTGRLEAGGADLVFSGAGGGNLSGKAENLTLSAWGAADIDLTDFAVNDSAVYLKGASQAVINASGRLSVELTGASRLEYVGSPTLQETSISGASVLGRVVDER